MRILVADDHEVVRRGIRSLIVSDPTLTVCGEASNGREAVEKAASLHPDIVVMDISMPEMNGLEATREIKRLHPEVGVVIVSQHDTPQMVQQAFNAGARAYVLKSDASANLLTAIGKVKNKESYLKPAGPVRANHLDPQEILQRSAAFEKALRESEERFRSAMNNMAEGLYTIDTQGLVTFVNSAAEAMFGWTASELLGKKMHDVIHYQHQDGTPFPASECRGLQVLQQGTTLREQEDVFIRKDGTFFPVVFSASPLTGNGKLTGLVVCFRDDTKRRQTEEALRQSDRLYRAIGESIDYGVWVCDATGRNIYTSPSFLNLVGLTQQQCSEFGWSEVLHPDDAPATIAAWQECIRAGTVWEREHRVRGSDGKWHHILARGGPIPDNKGNIQYWAGINLDIQHRKEAEIALRRAGTQFQLVTDTMAVAVTHCSRDLRYLWVNSRYAGWIGRTPEEIVNHPIVDVIGEAAFEKLRPYFARVLNGEPVQYEEQITFKELGARWVSAVYVPTTDPGGATDGWVASIVDITDRKRRDAELFEQARLLDLTFNAVIVWDAADRITYWNRGAEELYGWTRAEALGQVTRNLLRTQFPEPVSSILKRLKQEGRWQGELIHTAKNGKILTVLSRWASGSGHEGSSASVMQVNIDITQRKEAERQLHLLVETLETRIVERTQDLENATQKLRALSARLLQIQDEERRRIARELHDGTGQLLAAMSMSLAKLEHERESLSPDARQALADNFALVEQASQEIRTMSHLLHPPLLDEVGLESALRWYLEGFAERSKIDVSMDLPPGFSEELPRELSLAVFRIVQECLNNVHRHSASASALVNIDRSSDQITLVVKDHGRGISTDLQSRISSGEGSGVGLRGIRERIRQFDGHLKVLSQPGETSIVVTLSVPGSVANQKQENRAVIDVDQEVATILCIDDEEAGLLARKLLLESAGYRVLEARSGPEGIRAFRAEKVDVVILDYWMSGMKGTAVASELKRINPEVPIIVLSGMADLPGEAAGVIDQWLVKDSHRAEQLLNFIHDLLERRLV